MSLLEAMGYGIPVLSSDIKENTDVIKNMGHIFKSSNVDSLTHELGKLINDSEGLEEKAFRAREEVKTKYNWAKIAKKIEDTYIEILKTKNYKNISKLKQGAKLRFKK
jgi:glycosyltransferase involved in cell wall biosynthesis